MLSPPLDLFPGPRQAGAKSNFAFCVCLTGHITRIHKIAGENFQLLIPGLLTEQNLTSKNRVYKHKKYFCKNNLLLWKTALSLFSTSIFTFTSHGWDQCAFMPDQICPFTSVEQYRSLAAHQHAHIRGVRCLYLAAQGVS